MWNRIIALIGKEFLAVLRDQKIRISILLPPIIQLFIFTFASTLDVKNVKIGIVNRDNGEQAFELIERLHVAKVFKSIIHLPGMQAIDYFMDHQKGLMVVSFDEQFSRNLDAGKPAVIQLILDGRKSNTAQIVVGYTNRIVNRYNDDFSAKAGIKLQNVE